MSSICDHPKVQDKDKCKANLAGAIQLAESKGLTGPIASSLINRCAPCMMALGKQKGEDGMSLCDKANDLSSIRDPLPEEVKGKVPETCMQLVQMMQR